MVAGGFSVQATSFLLSSPQFLCFLFPSPSLPPSVPPSVPPSLPPSPLPSDLPFLLSLGLFLGVLLWWEYSNKTHLTSLLTGSKASTSYKEGFGPQEKQLIPMWITGKSGFWVSVSPLSLSVEARGVIHRSENNFPLQSCLVSMLMSLAKCQKVLCPSKAGRKPEIPSFPWVHIFYRGWKKLFSLIYSSYRHKVGSIFRNDFEPLRCSQGWVLVPTQPGHSGTCHGECSLSRLWFMKLGLYASPCFFVLAFAGAAIPAFFLYSQTVKMEGTQLT